MAPATDITDQERDALQRAVELAGRGAGTALPNPVVGCVLLDATGAPVGEGFHRRAGGPHAEVLGLAAAGESARGGTAVVTLEPCNHTGRTGPCSEALIAAGVARVVVAVRDPWRPAAGGIERLRSAGVDVVDLSELPASADAEQVNRVWLTATRLQRPFVTFKAGMTIDGRVAAADGSSRWITSEQSRADVHRLRSAVDTMMAGVGTVLVDDPQLTARGPDGAPAGRQPLRVVVDSRGRTPATARVLDDVAETLIATVAEFGAGPAGGVDLPALLSALYGRGRRHVLLEGGPRLAAAMFDANLVDEVLIYQAPMLLGAGSQVVAGGTVGTLADAHHFELRDVTRFGPDVRLLWVRS
ncbi:bifunctional diaminohydroxyphosphoribosylaminopyrimidine deaminase/5-amino-6-(5-phosphoribosylamino)uracil reductase RibD [Nakamurella lactea]|uniref:bifunctional diaminohydroxyphosphoribosylaminopyrimidine deaminase/5-amino-6-(5-phosphoribosylamino)uracil reductase RibD n=1 Tax=Nakamurella lactea TaxID=459515 RepID=UPI00042806B8|nr:bifunctional diaminohydroxyphosphoribosylaminopyrimidine deaminase/5-amino-6-(5-phosphoribosylamino)uracil reductase RibD [Nakamurella lactea]